MSLTKAIHFRKLITQLTHKECIQFISTLPESHINRILTGLFEYFSQSNQIDLVNDFNQSLLSMIQSRTEKPKPLCTNNIKLHELPRTIIGYTASFLDQSSYITFSLSNICVYLACNLPNTLQTLHLNRLKHYEHINLASFPSVKILRIDPMKAIKAGNMSFDSPNFHQLTTLRLFTNNLKHGWVQSFLNQNIFNCDHVTALQCSDFEGPKMKGNEFLSLLTAFPNLTHMDLHETHVPWSGDINAQEIAELCPRIVSFKSYGIDSDLISDLVNIFAKQLKYLSLEQPRQNQFEFGDTVFDALEELCFWGPDEKSCNGIVKSALNIKKIYLMYWKDWMSDDNIKDDITNLMGNCQYLNHICFIARPYHLGCILDGIECGLFAIKVSKTQRKKNLGSISVSTSKQKGTIMILSSTPLILQ
eukprot:850569_1